MNGRDTTQRTISMRGRSSRNLARTTRHHITIIVRSFRRCGHSCRIAGETPTILDGMAEFPAPAISRVGASTQCPVPGPPRYPSDYVDTVPLGHIVLAKDRPQMTDNYRPPGTAQSYVAEIRERWRKTGQTCHRNCRLSAIFYQRKMANRFYPE